MGGIRAVEFEKGKWGEVWEYARNAETREIWSRAYDPGGVSKSNVRLNSPK